MFNKINKAIKNPNLAGLYILNLGIFKFIPDRMFLKLKFKLSIKMKLNLDNPETFNEKLQWLKLNDRNPLYTKLVDKYEVRKHIAKIIGEEYLIPLIGVYNTFDEINFNTLPEKFVLKCNHDSGGVIICANKDEFNFKYAKNKINKSLKRNFYYFGREWPYKNVKPLIICEKYMENKSGAELKDYKFMCFNGKVKNYFICLNRNSTSLNVDFYDMEGNLMPFERHYKRSGTLTPKPINFEKMVELAEKLSKDIPFVRVDFYEIDEKVYFGEMTFYPGCGFEEFTPESFDYMYGSWIKLPIEDK